MNSRKPKAILKTVLCRISMLCALWSSLGGALVVSLSSSGVAPNHESLDVFKHSVCSESPDSKSDLHSRYDKCSGSP